MDPNSNRQKYVTRIFRGGKRKAEEALARLVTVEFVTEFAQPLSFKTLCAFLGWPSEAWENLRNWTRGNQNQALSGDKEAGAALAREFAGYVTEALQVRRNAGADASDDITASLMVTVIKEAAISDEDIVSLLRTCIAGGGTVAAALGTLVVYLAQHTDMHQQLRREPDLIAPAIDEILRADGPLVANRRTTTRDVEIERKKIGAGEKLSLIWIAANRGGRAIDNPDAGRFDRDPGDNLLFAAGIHYCLGAHLARLEKRVAIEELPARTTTVGLGTTEPLRRDAYPSNGFQAVPLHLR